MKQIHLVDYLANSQRIIDTVLPLLSSRVVRAVVVRKESIRIDAHVFVHQGLSLIVDLQLLHGVGFVPDVQMMFPSDYLPLGSMEFFVDTATVFRHIARLIHEAHTDTTVIV